MLKYFKISAWMGCVFFVCVCFFEKTDSFAQDNFIVIATSSFRYRGEFAYNVEYKVGDIVFEDSSSWVCIKYNNTNKDPRDSPNYWGPLLRTFMHKGDFQRNTEYNVGDIVNQDNKSWICRKYNNTDHDPHDSPNFWGQLAVNGKDGAQGPQGPQGPVGPPVTSIAICVKGNRCGCDLRTISNIPISAGGSCFATSDTGNCSVQISSSDIYAVGGCCVCSAE